MINYPTESDLSKLNDIRKALPANEAVVCFRGKFLLPERFKDTKPTTNAADLEKLPLILPEKDEKLREFVNFVKENPITKPEK